MFFRFSRLAPAAALAALLGGCVINPVPEGYKGTLAHIDDSAAPRDDISTDFFYVTKINGFDIPQSLAMTDGSHRDQGAARPIVVIGRDVPTQAATFTIVGHTRYTTAVYALTHPVYDITGDVNFIPKPDHQYVVKGTLSDNYSAVWIEDAKTGEVAGQKIEAKGSAALSTFGKLGLQ